MAVHINDLFNRPSRPISRSLTDSFFLPLYVILFYHQVAKQFSGTCAAFTARYTVYKRVKIITENNVLQLQAYKLVNKLYAKKKKKIETLNEQQLF